MAAGSDTAAAPLLEREAELSELAVRIERLRDDGAGGLVLIEGPPGIGKSSLLSRAVAGVPDAPPSVPA